MLHNLNTPYFIREHRLYFFEKERHIVLATSHSVRESLIKFTKISPLCYSGAINRVVLGRFYGYNSKSLSRKLRSAIAQQSAVSSEVISNCMLNSSLRTPLFLAAALSVSNGTVTENFASSVACALAGSITGVALRNVAAVDKLSYSFRLAYKGLRHLKTRWFFKRFKGRNRRFHQKRGATRAALRRTLRFMESEHYNSSTHHQGLSHNYLYTFMTATGVISLAADNAFAITDFVYSNRDPRCVASQGWSTPRILLKLADLAYAYAPILLMYYFTSAMLSPYMGSYNVSITLSLFNACGSLTLYEMYVLCGYSDRYYLARKNALCAV